MVHRGVTCGEVRAGGLLPLPPGAAWGWQLCVGSFRPGAVGNCRGELEGTGRRRAAISQGCGAEPGLRGLKLPGALLALGTRVLG